MFGMTCSTCSLPGHGYENNPKIAKALERAKTQVQFMVLPEVLAIHDGRRKSTVNERLMAAHIVHSAIDRRAAEYLNTKSGYAMMSIKLGVYIGLLILTLIPNVMDGDWAKYVTMGAATATFIFASVDAYFTHRPALEVEHHKIYQCLTNPPPAQLHAMKNIIYVADSYKIAHHNQYPDGTTNVYSYFESSEGKFDKVCFFGLQYIMKRWLVGQVINKQLIQQAKHFHEVQFGNLDLFNEEGWNYIVDKHNGYLPLRIKAVPEGTVVPTKNVLFTVENTDTNVPWLTKWCETILEHVWYPMTVCTNARTQKEIIAGFLHKTTDSSGGLPFQLHDFGYKGASSDESAGIGGAAHLINFMGTDTIAGLQLCKKYYGCMMAGFSIPAAEHSTITTWREVGESDAYRNMLTRFPEGLVSVVSDSFDIFTEVKQRWRDSQEEQVIACGEKGCLVIRPDSGDPATVVLKVLNILSEKFPCKENSKGYKVLPNYLRVMQGGISFETIEGILVKITSDGWSAENVVFGTGGALLQKLDRDTQKCAFKCSNVIINGESRNVCKNPSTDSEMSKKGRLTLERTADGEYKTVEEGAGDPSKDVLQLVYENGRLLVDWTLNEIREKAEIVEEALEHSTDVVNGLNKMDLKKKEEVHHT